MKESHIFDPKHVAVLEMEERKLWQNPDQILGLLDVKPEFVAADLGCGSGFFTVSLAKKVRKVYAIDVQKEMLRVLAQKIRKMKIRNVEPRLSEANRIPLEDGSVDILISMNTLHEFDDKRLMIKEIHRVLKPEGEVLIADFKKKDTGFGPPVAIRVSKKKAITIFEEGGFVTLRVQELPFHYVLVFSR